jgi:hypothetical protein
VNIHEEFALYVFGREPTEAVKNRQYLDAANMTDEAYWTSSKTTLLGWYILNSLTIAATSVTQIIT